MPRHRRGSWARDSWSERKEQDRTAFLEDDLLALEKALRPYSISINDDAHWRILLFAKELVSWNDRLNLLSRADAPNVIRKHVAASIGVYLVVQPTPGEEWLDVGTGAGFPGLILKIIRPDASISLLDSARKRCLFLDNTLKMLDLGKVPVLPLRAETLVARGDGLGAYSVVTARAVCSLEETLIGFGPLVARGGQIVTFKGPQWLEEVQGVRDRGVLEREGFELESATRIPWTAGHLLGLRKS
jgi:16S rRNA (guanine527-N7)-methyltransferase